MKRKGFGRKRLWPNRGIVIASTWRMKTPHSGQPVSRKIFETSDNKFGALPLRKSAEVTNVDETNNAINICRQCVLFKSSIFWDITTWRPLKGNKYFGGNTSPLSSGLKNNSSKKPE
jgi:hypothetical protein